MIKERIEYKENLPVELLVASIENYPIHFHDDLEVICVWNGSVKIKCGYYTYTLRANEIFVLNPNEIHSIMNAEEDNVISVLHVNIAYFSKYYQNLKDSFFLVDGHGNEDDMEVLRRIMRSIFAAVFQKGVGFEAKVIECAHNLISCLLADFHYDICEDGRSVNENGSRSDKILAGRLKRVMKYMHENYKQKLSLKEIADMEDLSLYYLSHVIKESTDMSFQELLGFIRIEEAEKYLLTTNMKISRISEEVGFSATRYFIKHFTELKGMTPEEYREKYAGRKMVAETPAVYRKITPREIEEEIIKKGLKDPRSEEKAFAYAEPIIIDVEAVKKRFNKEERNFDFDFVTKGNLVLLSKPYRILEHFEECVIGDSRNYIISDSSCQGEKPESLSVLIYNFDEISAAMLKAEADSKEKIIHILKAVDNYREFIVRFSGLYGHYCISRYKISRENIISVFEQAQKKSTGEKPRQMILRNWNTLPNVSFEEMTATDTLNIRSVLRGISAELILIDKL